MTDRTANQSPNYRLSAGPHYATPTHGEVVTEPKGMQPGDDRFPPLIRALHDARAAGHTELADCWACEAIASVHVQRLAIDSSTLATLEKAMARYGAPDHLTPLSRFYWLLERQPSANAIRAEFDRLDGAS